MKDEKNLYREKLKDPKWQFVRRLVFQRDNYTCQSCGAKREWHYVLEVHHKRYISGRKPWEYPSNHLVTLCSRCHRHIHGKEYIKPSYADTLILNKNNIIKEIMENLNGKNKNN